VFSYAQEEREMNMRENIAWLLVPLVLAIGVVAYGAGGGSVGSRIGIRLRGPALKLTITRLRGPALKLTITDEGRRPVLLLDNWG
jgi:hypothetical protein